MKVVLTQDLSNLGRRGDVLEVADGYARNYLLPTNRAFQATRGALRQAEAMQRSRGRQEAKEKAELVDLAERIQAVKLTTAAKAGAEGQLFGSVTSSEIAHLLSRAVGQEIDRRKIVLAEPIKSLGVHTYRVHLHTEVVAEGSVEVSAQEVSQA